MSSRGAPSASAITVMGRWLANWVLNSQRPSAAKPSSRSCVTCAMYGPIPSTRL